MDIDYQDDRNSSTYLFLGRKMAMLKITLTNKTDKELLKLHKLKFRR